MDLTQEVLLKLIVAVLVGAIIGVEREWHNKTAGLRTISLITVGSTLFTILSLQSCDGRPACDNTRIMANIPTGIGFLGAGVILLSGGRIRGLTTASSIWVAAAVGVAVGLGEYEMALFVAGLVVIVLWLFAYVARFVEARARETLTYEITYTPPRAFERIEQLFKKHRLYIRERKRFKRQRVFVGQWQVDGSLAQHEQFVKEVFTDKAVLELRY